MKNIILHITNFGLIMVLLLAFGCTQQKATNKTNAVNSDLLALQQLMTGSYNSAQQASQDQEFYDISLHMYPIWKNREGHWLYVEQALNVKQDAPYRQRIYELYKDDSGRYVSKVYTLPDDKVAIGKWADPNFFNNINPQDLTERTGCAVYLEKISASEFKGSTHESDCESSLRGASYATSIVHILENKIISWDQGFDADGNQVWGAVKGGYIFDKL